MVALVLACVAVTGLVASATADISLVVKTNKGLVSGVETSTLFKFLGIPYAAAPMGDLRWAAPKPHASWKKTGTLDATNFGNHCPQPSSPFGTPSDTEDCLYLNVFAPKTGSGYPVMVWIHGGSLWLGESDDYDPTRLVEQGVVVVTINYRLGDLGFLSHSALGKPHGNYGLMDQQLALKWVKQNIAHFGGNPKNVTIFGESAGALSVHSQLASPKAKGLFHKAIVESGAYSLAQESLDLAEQDGSAWVAAETPCGGLLTAKLTAACLRALTVDQVLTAQGTPLTGFVPIVDGKVLTRSIGDAFSSGQFNRVPVIEGSNHDEWRLFVELFNPSLTADQYPSAIAITLHISSTELNEVLYQYPLGNYASAKIALGAVGTDAIFACNARTAAQLLSQYVTTFAYEFNDPDPPMIFLPPDPGFPYGAYHAAEIPYIFDTPTAVYPPVLDDDQKELSATMIGYWTQFAKTSIPDASWPQYKADTDERESFVPPTPGVESGFAVDHQCAFWASLGG
jgi:para-nitrobenzyl esterase